MAKRSSRSRKSSKTAGKSLLLRLFTFPKIILALFIIVGAGFYFFSQTPLDKVKGVNTDSSFEIPTPTNSSDKWNLLISVDFFKDYDKDGKWDKKGNGVKGKEQCITGEFIVKVDEKNYPVTTSRSKNNKWCNPGSIEIDVTDDPFKCVEVSFVKKTEGDWKVTGITYPKGQDLISKKGKSKAKLCPISHWDNNFVTLVYFGLIKKQD